MGQGASKTTLSDKQPSTRGVPTLNRDVLRIIGVCEWGPLDAATPIIDFDHFREVFGPGRCFLASYETPVQLQQWFLGRGRKAIVVRTNHKVAGVNQGTKATYTAQTGVTAATKGSVTGTNALPVALADGDTLDFSVNGGATDTATFNATAAVRTCANSETYALADGMTLTVSIDGGSVQTITFNTAEFVAIGTATAEEVCAVINGELLGARATGTTDVTITSDTLGTGSGVNVTGGTSNAALGFVTGNIAGTGDAVNSASVTGAELKTLIEGDVTGVTVSGTTYLTIETDTAGSGGSVQVEVASTADDELGLDNATHAGFDGLAANTLKIDGKYIGAMGNQLACTISAATSGVASEFDLKVYLYGGLKKTYRNVTMDTAATRYVETVVNTGNESSLLIAVTDQSATGTATQRRPANVSTAALTGGDDGLTSLDDNDFLGSTAYDDGLFAFETNEDGDILVCPDRPTVAFQNGAFIQVETEWQGKNVFIPDPPDGSDKDAIVVHMGSLTYTDYAAGMPWPRVKIPNPSKTVYGQADTIEVGPSCSWAARMARNSELYDDQQFHQPGNQDYGLLTNVVGLEGETDEVKHEVLRGPVRDYVTDYRVNPVVSGRRVKGGFGVWVNDVQSMNPDSELWASVGEARGLAILRKEIEAYIETRRTQNNTVEFRMTDQDVITGYMMGWTVKGAFATKKVSEAFYVNTDPQGLGINNAQEQADQNYHIIVAPATARPARFVGIQFTRDTRAIESFIQRQKATA